VVGIDGCPGAQPGTLPCAGSVDAVRQGTKLPPTRIGAAAVGQAKVSSSSRSAAAGAGERPSASSVSAAARRIPLRG
jgi:hypothetical protein